MLTISGGKPSHRFCDGTGRRNFLKIGGLGLGGLALPDLLRAGAAAPGGARRDKAVIMIYMPGGPPHQDMYDIKEDAPSEIRGEFKSAPTRIPGLRLCEHLPRIGAIADQCVFVRAMVGAKDRHYSHQCLTGRHNDNAPAGGWPEIGSAVAKLDADAGRAAGSPPYINLSPKMRHKPYNFGEGSFLGAAHKPFRPNGDTLADMTLEGVTPERLGDRAALLRGFDRLRRDVDASGEVAGLDGFNQQALDILTSSKLAEALDISREPDRVRARYGDGTAKEQGDAAPRLNGQFLAARRLVEAGARVVTLSYSFWDWHGSNFKHAKENLPDFDQAYSALVEDLADRGMLDDVTVIAWGEFGRSPKINAQGGRDHWPGVSCALLSGGGMNTGFALGSTDRLGGEAADRPVEFPEIFATLYHNLGIDAAQTTVTDLTGRPRYLVEGYAPVAELV